MAGPRFHLDHLFAARRLSAYVDEDLELGDRARVRRHLGQCPDCGRAERSLRLLLGGLRSLRRRPSPALADEAVGRVRAAERSRTHARRR